jgi:hypothetical protein
MQKEKLHIFKFALIAVIILTDCHKNKSSINSYSNDMCIVKENDWNKLSDKKIFFGHQSVGNNIIEGIKDLKDKSKTSSFIILETRDKSDFIRPLFAHSYIGKNTDPKSKIDDFVNILNSGLADSVDIAIMKLCYIDINRKTNIDELFEYYKTAISSIQLKHPRLKIIHSTVPVTTKPEGYRGVVKKFLKMDDNYARNRYNELLRNHYKGKEIFDIAFAESIYSGETTNNNWEGVPGLISEYTSDGGHLNKKGRSIVAFELIKKLLMNIDEVN